MHSVNRLSFLSILLLIVLLPVFFIPATILPLGSAKVVLVALVAIVALIALGHSILRRDGAEFPSHHIMWAMLAFPAVYLASSFSSSTPSLSLYGYGFEVGTAGFMILASVLFGITAMVFSDGQKVLRALAAILISLGIVAIFALVKILTGGSFPVWGTFYGNMGNPVGSWADYAVLFGFMATLSVLALGIMRWNIRMKVFFYTMFGLSTLLLMITNFSTAFIFTLVTSIVLVVYLLTIEKKHVSIGRDVAHGTDGANRTYTGSKVTVWPAIALCAVSLLFLINPVVSATRGTIGETVSGVFGVTNVDVRPSFMATLDISGAVLGERPLLGEGPNTFLQSWLVHKPQEINRTEFWNAGFPSGFGFIPTQVSSVGLLGIAVWLLFFVVFLLLGLRAMGRLPQGEWDRLLVVSTFLGSFFLWMASFMYTPSMVVLILAFILTGLFVAACRATGVVGTTRFSISRNIVFNFVSVLLLVGLGIGAVAFGFSVFQRTVSAYHFQRAIVLSNTEGANVDQVEDSLVKAIRLVPSDRYWGALAEISIARAQAALTATEGTQEENTEKFQTALSRGIAAAQAATNANPSNYRNWVVLGSIYSSLVPEPFAVEGAYESAKSALEEAKKRNPNSPEVPVLLARLEIDNGNVALARPHIEEALRLKEDYADAYLLLTQIEIQQNNVEAAIRSAETTALLTPDNAGVFFQLGLLRYSNENYTGAAAAFNQALRILPEYANAKYFLGLALDKMGDKFAALSHFEQLARTNPENQELPLIIENLKEGKDALDGFPSETDTVETLPSTPITETEQ